MYEICLNSIEAWKKLQPGDFFYTKNYSGSIWYMWELLYINPETNVLEYYFLDVSSSARLYKESGRISNNVAGSLYATIKEASYKRIFMRKLNEKL